MLNYILPQIRKRNHAALHFTKEILEGQNLFVIKIIKLTPLQAIFPIFVKSEISYAPKRLWEK